MPTSHQISEMLRTEMSSVVGLSMVRLVLASILGGAIGLEREMKHRPAGLRTNMFICFGAAMFTILSDLMVQDPNGDHTRIAAQIITGIGFIGAGSILHSKGGPVTGLTTAATLFVVASIGMAVGGGFYLTATFATVIILGALFLLGDLERGLSLKRLLYTYEVVGPSAEEITAEVNEVLENIHGIMENVQVAPARDHVRVQFDLSATTKQQREALRRLMQSSSLARVTPLGPAEIE